MFEFIVMILFVWRISVLLTFDSICKDLRDKVGVGLMKDGSDEPLNFWSWMLGCFWCCSLIVALLANLLAPCASASVMIMRPFAVSGAAILIHYAARIHLVLRE